MTWTIPVAFSVNADTEIEAARWLTDRLANANLIEQVIESWWLPNHPEADGSDNESVLLFHDLWGGYAGATNAHERQLMASGAIRALRMTIQEAR